MSDFLDDLSKATTLFKQGTQGLALQQALTNANEEVQRIKNTTKDANQLRSDTYAVAQGLTLKMLGIGADPQTVAAASQGILGPQAQNAEQAVLIGQQTGQQSLWDQGQALIAQQQKQKLEQIDATGEWQLKNTALSGRNALAAATAGREAKPLKDMPEALQTQIAEGSSAVKATDALIRKHYKFNGGIDKLGSVPLAGDVVNFLRDKNSPEFAAYKSDFVAMYLQNQKKYFGTSAKDLELEKLTMMSPNYDLSPEKSIALLRAQRERYLNDVGGIIESQAMLGHNVGAYAQQVPQSTPRSSAYTMRNSSQKTDSQQAPQPLNLQAPPVVDQRPVTLKSDNQLMQEDLASQPLAGSGVRNAAISLLDTIKSNRKTVAEQKKEQLRQAEEARKERVRKLREGRGTR